MAGRIDQNQGAQHARFGKRQGNQGLLEGQSDLTNGIGESATFFLFAAMCVLSFIFVWRFVPETRGHSLEEIQEMWNKGGSIKSWDETAPKP